MKQWNNHYFFNKKGTFWCPFFGYPKSCSYLYDVEKIKKQVMMNHETFSAKYQVEMNELVNQVDVREVLWTIASSLSDAQHEGVSEEANDRINDIKNFIFDYMDVLKQEEREVVINLN